MRPPIGSAASPEEQGNRLKMARLAKGYHTATDAARRLGIAVPTYLAHENGTRQIRYDLAVFYARSFGIDVNTLLVGAPGRTTPNEERSADERPGSGGGASEDRGEGAPSLSTERARIALLEKSVVELQLRNMELQQANLALQQANDRMRTELDAVRQPPLRDIRRVS